MMASLTQQQLEDLFWRATVMVLGLDPDSEDESIQKRVRISWPQSDEGNSTWGRNENVIFLRIAPSPDDYTLLKEITYRYDAEVDDLIEKVNYHRFFSINWVCYGPDALDDADKLKDGILRSNTRALLRKSNVAVLPHMREPVRLTEQDDSGDWWERYDLTGYFYSMSEREYSEGMITAVPEVTIDSN